MVQGEPLLWLALLLLQLLPLLLLVMVVAMMLLWLLLWLQEPAETDLAGSEPAELKGFVAGAWGGELGRVLLAWGFAKEHLEQVAHEL